MKVRIITKSNYLKPVVRRAMVQGKTDVCIVHSPSEDRTAQFFLETGDGGTIFDHEKVIFHGRGIDAGLLFESVNNHVRIV